MRAMERHFYGTEPKRHLNSIHGLVYFFPRCRAIPECPVCPMTRLYYCIKDISHIIIKINAIHVCVNYIAASGNVSMESYQKRNAKGRKPHVTMQMADLPMKTMAKNKRIKEHTSQHR